ncbi:Endonuclease/exonuclease/phosphatase [Gongronella butleri]|nr:Endonuclease/exonuclease/phosphatase [Gongronella butleri]
MADADTLRVLTLNCWGLLVVSKKRRSRLEAIAHALVQCEYDLVTLQEVWVQSDFDFIKQRAAQVFPHIKYFYSGTLGSGHVMLSKFPFVSTSYWRYSLAGRPLKVFHGDFYVGKGCASACIQHPVVGLLQVFTTHLHAGYGKTDEYRGHRISETWELTCLIRDAASQGRQVIVTGDFNSVPSSFNYKILRDHGLLADSWFEMHAHYDGSCVDGHEDEDDQQAYIQRHGVTCNSSANTWSKHYGAARPTGSRLDYIFYRPTAQMTCTQSRVDLFECVPGERYSYSDHFGVCSTFKIAVHDVRAVSPQHPCDTRLTPGTLEEIILLLQSDQRIMQRTARRRLICFALLVLLTLALYVAIVAVPGTTGRPAAWVVPFVLGLLLILASVSAVIFLIVGFVFGFSEAQTMQQFVDDLHTLLAALEGQLVTDGAL